MSDSNNIQQLAASVTSAVDDDLKDFEPLQSAAKKMDVKPSTIILVTISVLLVISLVFPFFAEFSITLFSTVYPSYMSFKALSKGQQQPCKKWLTYWIVFAFATVFDRLISTVLFFLPAYYAFKLLFFIWMFYPRTDGANVIYQQFLKPQLQRIKAMSE